MTAGPAEALHSWMPHSPCGAWCLPTGDALPKVSPARRALRLATLVAVVLTGPLCALTLSVLGPRGRAAVIRGWFRMVLGALGVRLRVYRPGALSLAPEERERPRDRGVLVVGNHSSWLDIVALNALQPVRMLAKAQVRHWPLIGALAARAGTFFVDRPRLSTLPATVAEVAGALRGGAAVGVFPEGTTWCGQATGRWKRAAFQAAIDAGVPARPVALRFVVDEQCTTAAGFLGEETLLTALLRTAALRGLVIEASVLPLVSPEGHDRRSMAAAAEAAVTEALGQPEAEHAVPEVAAAA
ncbi:lysophospholipid acyltransferase family protein [Crossiella sp. CA-258035]|uniref:lysophospholipid acyltransferase family protein n=1 Tax=Crossiella sp. CA-258035 TaxID=2981138 RepID=UPI0024BD4E77|nr:lysophospholipid acyltransferase family protein [Crossiella sp. CA-258035]WHT18195.1 lysophospholipid acyltransferase family protein [Crossiella sp. CA-258035]